MNTSIQIGKIMGIPIKLHITFLLILPVFAYYFSVNPAPFGFNDVQLSIIRYALSLSAAISLFICVLLHELGHSSVAKKNGSNIQSITLFLFGGVSAMEEIPRNPKIEFKMALAGPGVSFLIGMLLGIVYIVTKPVDLSYTAYMFQNISDNPYLRLIWLIGYINIILGIFNLLPAFPMDGGRVLRAWLAGRMSYIKATRTAAGIGKMFAIVMGIFGLFAGLWFILIAFFIYIGASEEEKSTEVTVVLEGVKIRDIMSKNVTSVTSGMSVEELVDIMFRFKHMGYPVLDDSEVKGIVTFTDVQKVPKEDRKKVRVSEIMTKELITLREDDDAVNAIKLMTVNNIGRIVITKEKQIVGIVSRTDILRSVQLLE
ncbi:MAG: CBS domain-containing protein [Candidatus Methanoperedens sp.]|nr:CBS domain-containing protein [Candidatus Methanoperedens sp.]